MMSCNIIQDILPLYIDDAVSDDTKKMVEDHIKHCPNCQKELETLKKEVILVTNEKIQADDKKLLQNLQKKLKHQKIIISFFTVIAVLSLLFIGTMVVENVGFLYDFFYPRIDTQTKIEQSEADQWQQLKFDTGDYLIFDSLFFKKEVVHVDNYERTILLRIKDTAGNIIIKTHKLDSAQSISLKKLKRNQPYIVEIKGKKGEYFFNFI